MFPEPTELRLIGCSIELTWTPKSKSSTSTPKTNLLTCWPKEVSRVMSGNHLLCLFNISRFSPTACTAAMAKRAQQESGEGRVTAKSKPMMNLIARTPSFVSSSTSVSPGKRYYGKQDPWKSVVAEDRSGQPDRETESFSSTDYSRLDYDRAWSSQEWKAEVTTHYLSGQLDKTSWRMVQQVRPHHEPTLLDGTAQSVRYGEPLRDSSGQPDNVNSQEAANSQNFIMGSDCNIICEPSKWWSSKKTEKNVQRCGRRRRTFYNLENVYGCDDECSDIRG